MAKLELRLKGPLQSWGGYGGNLNYHPTEIKPTVSGITGLIAACLGIRRSEPERLQELRESISLDIPDPENYPVIYRDFQVVHPIGTSISKYLNKEMLRPEDYDKLPGANGGLSETGQSKLIIKEYIVNQEYVVYIDGEEDVLSRIKHAIYHPRFQPYLGRKCCIPSKLTAEWI